VSDSISLAWGRAERLFNSGWGYAPWWTVVAALAVGLAAALLPLAQAVLLLVGGAALVAMAIRPIVGLGVLLVVAPLGAWEAHRVNLGGFDSGQLLFFLVLAAWLAQGVRRGRIVVPPHPLYLPLLLFGAVGAVSLLDAPSATLGMKELVKWVEMAVMMWIVAGMVAAHGARPVVALLLGLYQFGFQADVPDHFAILDERFYRAYGTFMQPNPFGAFVSWAALLGAGTLLGAVTRWWEQRRLTVPVVLWWAFLAACTLVAAGGLVASWSRGAWLAFAAGAAALALFAPRRRWVGAVLLGGALVGFVGLWQLELLPGAITERLTSFALEVPSSAQSAVDVRGVEFTDENFAVIERLAHWQAALDIARQEPWLGAGFGNYEAAYPEVALPNWTHPLGHAHNYYLNLLAEVGALGLAAYLVLWGAIFVWTLRALRGGSEQRGIVLGLLAIWVALTVHHMLDKLYVNNLYLHLGALLGILHGFVPARSEAVA
jgi:putative inorganic carbon (hco3(-)) transporter